MAQQDLREQLVQLANEIDQLTIDDQRKVQLQALIERVEQQLETDDAEEPRDLRDQLRDQLEEAVSQFEAEHPTLTGVMRRVLMTLSSMGV